MTKRYISHDPRFGTECNFTLPEMIAQYRMSAWDEYEDENGNTCTMTDEEIIDDILNHDVEEIA
ncbi:MAG: hypothetical protein WC600_17295 [Desulfobaccales bacterium]